MGVVYLQLNTFANFLCKPFHDPLTIKFYYNPQLQIVIIPGRNSNFRFYIQSHSIFSGMVLQYLKMSNPGLIKGNYFNIPPDTHSNQLWPPIPAKIAGLFSKPAASR